MTKTEINETWELSIYNNTIQSPDQLSLLL